MKRSQYQFGGVQNRVPHTQNGKKKKNNKWKIIGIIIVFLSILIGVWLWINNKSDWYCENGVWVSDGDTEEPRPIGLCPGVGDGMEREKPNQKYIEADSKKIIEGINIRIYEPHVNATVTSPLMISGEAKDWFVDDSFDARLLDEKGEVIASGEAHAVEDIVAGEYVKFELELSFDAEGLTAGGDIFLKKSDSAETPGSFSFPIFFK